MLCTVVISILGIIDASCFSPVPFMVIWGTAEVDETSVMGSSLVTAVARGEALATRGELALDLVLYAFDLSLAISS